MKTALQAFHTKFNAKRKQMIVALVAVYLLCVALAILLAVTDRPHSVADPVKVPINASRTLDIQNAVTVSNIRSITLTLPWDGIKQLDYSFSIPTKGKIYPPGTVYYVTMAPKDYNTVATHYNALESLIYLGQPVLEKMGIPYNSTVEYRLVPR